MKDKAASLVEEAEDFFIAARDRLPFGEPMRSAMAVQECVLRGSCGGTCCAKGLSWGDSVQLPTEEDVIVLSDDSDSETEIFEAEEDVAAELDVRPSMGLAEVGFFSLPSKTGIL